MNEMKGIQERIQRETLEKLREYEAEKQARKGEYRRKSIDDIIQELLTEVKKN